MFQVQWVDLKIVLKQLNYSMTTSVFDNYVYTHTGAIIPILSALIAFTYALYILAYPPKYRKLSIALLAIPVGVGFWHQQLLAPNETLCDTFGRFLYIWLAHMSYQVTILEWSPPIIKENDGWKSRVRAAYKVLFARSPEQDIFSVAPRHNLSHQKFLLYHALKAFHLYLLQNLYFVCAGYYITSSDVRGADKAIFFRRLPESLDAAELWRRLDTTIHWCVLNMYLYDAYHSVFAVFFVGLGFDKPSEWSLSLFGPISEAWSVRRYWGKHWHNYIYHSFSAHTKIVTRNWLGMKRGRVATRLVENTMVFGVSGIMHTLVRVAQDGPNDLSQLGITFWYLGQMVPIIIEDVVQVMWRQKKKELGIRDYKWLRVLERTAGYVWVFGFNAWSVPKYIHMKAAWSEKLMLEKYGAEWEKWEGSQVIVQES
jgi:hypothetical protein